MFFFVWWGLVYPLGVGVQFLFHPQFNLVLEIPVVLALLASVRTPCLLFPLFHFLLFLPIVLVSSLSSYLPPLSPLPECCFPWDPGFITNVEKNRDHYFSSTSRSDPHSPPLWQREPLRSQTWEHWGVQFWAFSLLRAIRCNRSLHRGALGRRKELFLSDPHWETPAQ